MAGKVILHVDDEPDVLALVKVVMEREGFKVVGVEGGQAAMEKLKALQGNVDVMLLDIMMPKMSGWEVLKRVRKDYPGVRVIFLSVVKINETMLEDLKKDGLADYIQKPVSNQELVERVKKVAGS